jgi:hypothetical protein
MPRPLIALLFCFFLALPAQADEEGQLFLARHLASLEPYSAVTEYLRFLYLFPESPLVGQAKEELGGVFEERGMGAHARRWWQAALEDGLNPRKLQLRIAESYFRDGDILSARLIYQDLRSEGSEVGACGYLHCLMREYRWGEAKEAAAELSEKDPAWRPLSLSLEEAVKIPYLLPERAAVLSTYLPGSGQIYAGQLPSSLGSLLLNGGGVFFALSRLSKGDWIGSLAFLSLTSRFYQGGIENAREFAAFRNEKMDRAFLEQNEGKFPKK